MNVAALAPYLIELVFGIALATTVVGALIAVCATRIIRSVCGLALCCCGLAGLYYFLQSPFLSLMEILIYVGAICVTIIFAVMLAEPDEAPPRGKRSSAIWWGGCAFVACAVCFGSIARLGLTTRWPVSVVRVGEGSLKDIGIALLTTYSFAFELISLVLLIAVLGALVVARQGRTRS